MLKLTKKYIKPIAWLNMSPIGEGYDIIHIYVSPTERRKGIAKKMVSDFIEKFKPKSIMLEVRKSNVAAIGLYKNLGFEVISERKNYYQNSEDALVMKINFKGGFPL